MDIPISAASLDLDQLVRRAQAGEEVVLTENGEPVARLEPVPQKSEASRMTPAERMARIKAALAELPKVPDDGISAARSQDFLYGEDGLPK